MSLNGHIKGSCWLVTDKDIRTTSQGNGNNDTLTHPTRVLERIFVETFFSIRNTNLVHVVNGHFFSFFSRFSLVFDNDFNNLATDSLNWVKTGHRILEDSRNLSPTNRCPILVTLKLSQILTTIINRTAGYTTIFFKHPSESLSQY